MWFKDIKTHWPEDQRLPGWWTETWSLCLESKPGKRLLGILFHLTRRAELEGEERKAGYPSSALVFQPCSAASMLLSCDSSTPLYAPKEKTRTTNCHESRMEVEKQAAEKDEQPLSCAKCSVPSERHVSLLEVWALFVAHPQTCHRLSGSIWAGAAYGKCSTCLCEGSHFCLKSWDTTLVSLFRQTSYFCTSNPGAPDRHKSLAIRKLCSASKLRYNFTTGWFIFTHICLRM